MTVKVDEEEIVKVYKGQKLRIELNALQEMSLEGSVVSIGTKADYALQYGVEIIISENPGERLKAGMVAQAIFSFTDEEVSPLIPRNALVGSIKDPKVYIMHENKAHLRPITIAQSQGDQIKVFEGISEGEQLIVAGQFNLQDRVNVKVIN